MEVDGAEALDLNKKFFNQSISEFSYIGWIPCILGELFFKYAEPGLAHYSPYLINHDKIDEAHNSVRTVLCSSCFDSCDNHYPLISHSQGLARYTVISSVSNSNYLSGVVYITPLLNGYSSDNWEPKLKSIARAYKQTGQSPDFNELISKFQKYEQLICEKPGFYKIEFLICESGFTLLRSVAKPSNECGLLSNYAVFHMAFVYLKYMLHSHKHHPDETDSITRIHEIDPAIQNCRELIGQMSRDFKRSLAAFRRKDSLSDESVLGIGDYASSLLSSSKKAGLLNCDSNDNSGFDVDEYINREKGYFIDGCSSLNKAVQCNVKKNAIAQRSFNVAFYLISAFIITFCYVPFSKDGSSVNFVFNKWVLNFVSLIFSGEVSPLCKLALCGVIASALYFKVPPLGLLFNGKTFGEIKKTLRNKLRIRPPSFPCLLLDKEDLKYKMCQRDIYPFLEYLYDFVLFTIQHRLINRMKLIFQSINNGSPLPKGIKKGYGEVSVIIALFGVLMLTIAFIYEKTFT